ncbi:MAG: MBL fold metallo-hydrolase [Bacteroidia bacterium]|nr:MBL fold metallo-hydrolase [Bacteroidia bacterium]
MSVSLRMLGTGTSQGVPAIGCDCETCTSADDRDRRLRPSVLFSVDGINLLVDTSSDFRQQMLRHRVPAIHAVLYTHHHFDHIGGFDDLRQYNFIQSMPMPLYGMQETLDELSVTFRYAFGHAKQVGGGLPVVEKHTVDGAQDFFIAGVRVVPLPALHGRMSVLGYRIGRVAYLTDVSEIPASTLERLSGLDVLVLDALRHRAHPTHLSLQQAIGIAENIAASRTYFTHIAHNIKHERDSVLLPETMEFSYDGLLITSDESSP